MATPERIDDVLQHNLEAQYETLAASLRHEVISNALISNLTTMKKLELNELIKMAKSSYIPTLLDLAAKIEKVDAAVCTLTLGMYGLCADCEEEIETDDLLKDPAQPRCRACREHSRYHHDE
ncbi:TraR/DksA C4-type zinc finger protein [Photobacterium sanguinicancri]|uniref:TraR/DksA C4-type zinc finger protein n=1 Tax=Photobacterium sanguinicancri TaxID=875932 RepID=UPI0026E2C85D|nr:TraR/DksA C4-type zinc finger protein [Photobacterium sanguinicancri]MDO6497478.1 TraR/DksA C4-type zinc finger protein [Photobacterium sanguinicancri]